MTERNLKTAYLIVAGLLAFAPFCAVCSDAASDDAASKLKEAADAGKADAAWSYALTLQNDSKAKREYAKYVILAAQGGEVHAKLACAEILMDGVLVPKNDKAAFAYLTSLVRTDEMLKKFSKEEVCRIYYGLGRCYDEGLGTAPDGAMGAKYYFSVLPVSDNAKKALCVMFFHGNGVPKSSDVALGLGFSFMLNDYGRLDEIVKLIKKNRAEIPFASMMEGRAEVGDAGAAVIYGKMLLSGTIYPVHRQKGLKYLTDAADNGDASAAYEVGAIYEKGLYSISIDRDKAIDFYRRSVAYGNKSDEPYKALARVYAKKNDYVSVFECLAASGDLEGAEKVIEGHKDAFNDNHFLYLKALKYKNSIDVKTASAKEVARIEDRFRMASNTGYPPAMMEYVNVKRRATAEERLAAIDAQTVQNDPKLMFMKGKLLAENPSLDKDNKALSILEKAADRGSLEALAYMADAYRTGKGINGVAKDVSKAAELENTLVRRDYLVRYPAVFNRVVIKAVASGNEKKASSKIQYLIRSSAYNQIAAFYLGKLLVNGDKRINVSADPWLALVLFAQAAGNDMNPTAVRETESLWRNGTELFAPDVSAAELYKPFLK